jgi:cellulose biosynthesis protein BcsQ
MSNRREIARADRSSRKRALVIDLDPQWANDSLRLVDIDYDFPSQVLELGDD